MPPLTEPAVAPGTLSSQPQPILRPGPVTLRPFALDDAADLVLAYADPEIQRWHGRTLTTGEARRWIEAATTRWNTETAAEWAVTARARVVGRIGLHKLNLTDGTAEIAYWTMPGQRGRGYATSALEALGEWAFALGFGRLELLHSVDNIGSCRVAERAGYELEGTKRRAGLHVDGWHDMHLHALISS